MLKLFKSSFGTSRQIDEICHARKSFCITPGHVQVSLYTDLLKLVY